MQLPKCGFCHSVAFSKHACVDQALKRLFQQVHAACGCWKISLLVYESLSTIVFIGCKAIAVTTCGDSFIVVTIIFNVGKRVKEGGSST
jgi:hypothetical protein